MVRRVVRELWPDEVNALATLPLFRGADADAVAVLWGRLPRLLRLRLLTAHLDAIPGHWYSLMLDLRPLPGFDALRARVPDEDAPWIQRLRAAPDPLPALTAALATLPEDARVRAESSKNLLELGFLETLWRTAGYAWGAETLDLLCSRFSGEPGIGVVAVFRLDLWRTDGEHLGGCDRPFTALAAENGRLIVGDAEGVVWEVELPLG